MKNHEAMPETGAVAPVMEAYGSQIKNKGEKTMNDMNDILSQREAEATQDTAAAFGQDVPFQIYMQNKVTQEKHSIFVLGDNTMGQILEGYGSKIGIKAGNKKVLFFNKRTGQQSNGLDTTVRQIGLCAEDILQITDDGSVAAE